MALMHQTVLLDEAVTALVTTADGVYIDGTFGRGGHTRHLLDQLSAQGRVIGFDKDPAAEACARTLSASDARFSFCHASFADVPAHIDAPVMGVLLDLGVSSPQLDDATRGFSFREDGPLDMRMDNSTGITAADWINTADEQDIAAVLREYGEERFARRIATAIVAKRPFERTTPLAEVVASAIPRWEKHKHPATRSFQAIRIFINRELDDLERLLAQFQSCLEIGGRLVVISFHSLEDRIVKRFMRDASRGHVLPRGVPVTEAQRGQTLRLVGKAVRAGDAEVASNPRARSAIMRVAERIA